MSEPQYQTFSEVLLGERVQLTWRQKLGIRCLNKVYLLALPAVCQML